MNSAEINKRDVFFASDQFRRGIRFLLTASKTFDVTEINPESFLLLN